MRQRKLYAFNRRAHKPCGTACGKTIQHVEPPEQTCVGIDQFVHHVDDKRRAARRSLAVDRKSVARTVQAVTDCGHLALGDDFGAAPVVRIDDRALAIGEIEPALLGATIDVLVAEKVEVISAQIGENGRFRAHSGELAVIYRVRRQLHDNILCPLGGKTRKQRMQLGRIGRGQIRRGAHSAALVVHRPDQRRAHAAPLQDAVYQIGCRRLAVGAHDGDNLELFRRVSAKIARRNRKRSANVLNRRARNAALCRNGRKNRFCTSRDSLAALLLRAGFVQTDKQVAALCLARLERYPVDVDVGVGRLCARSLQNFAQ